MSISVFTPSAYGEVEAIQASTSIALPGGDGTALVVTNLGLCPAVVLLGDSSISVTPATGIGVPPHQQLALAVGSATHLAALVIGDDGARSLLNLAQGT